ncbi:epimerase [Oryctes borbonicus]|uniref:Fatty acyl-CoA reductase n=1 Tax=Oryctes borbonicus TaxID=1629725 RepID=A0A0T6BDN9_9SCAR|nr:epimerase [Oryctes borbonicus]
MFQCTFDEYRHDNVDPRIYEMNMPPLIEEAQEAPLTPIQKFYSGANVFITGGTGFIGQLLVEKLLRSCPDIGNIYLLIREKKNKNMVTRIDEILDECIFDKLKIAYPKYKYKVVGIEGDCGLPKLGINEQERRLLTNEVNVVFHVAATVNFDEKLKTAVNINVKGTKELLTFCKEMTKLKAVVHVSTAFSNCAEDVIEEIFYPTPIEYNKLITLTEILSEDALQKITPNILGNLPNTYAFTKAIAENMIQEEGKNLPLGIYRPSIVVSTYKEPLRGWINNMYGAVGVTVGAGMGLLRVIHCDSDANANIVPADMCVNGLIAVPWEASYKYQKSIEEQTNFEIPIYNYESSQDQPINWSKYMELTSKYGTQNPTANALWYYSLNLIKHKFLYQLAAILVHFVPAIMLDALLLLIGRKTRFFKIYTKIYRFSRVISYFSTKNFKFRSTRMRQLISKMSDGDRAVFMCDLKKLNWEEYFKYHFIGVRLYILKDPLSTLPEAIRKFNRLYWCHQMLKIILGFTAMRITWNLIACALLNVSGIFSS